MEDINDKSSSSSQKNITSSQNTLKTISLNFINSNNYNLNDAQIFENNKENSYYDKDLNEKIIKLFIGDHPLLPMKTIEKIAHCNFMNQHYKNKDFYNIKVIDEIIHNESSHIVAEFKDYLIKGDTSEFIMKFYKKRESINLLPKISECYINCSVIFPNYVILPESKYIYKNIKKKQRVIDIQQEQEEREENIKNGVYEQEKEPTIFTTQAFDSILNQTDTSGVKRFFDISHEKSGECSSGVFKLMNNIETAEKKLGNNSKKNKINVCKLKKGNNEFQYNYKKNITLNDPGYNKKLQSAFNNKKGEGGIFNENKFIEKNNINFNINNNNIGEKNIDLNINKNNLKQLLRQSTENNNTNTNNNTNNHHHRKNNNFSTQVTYIDSCNHHMKNPFDLKGIETIKKIGKNSKNLKEIKNDNKDFNINDRDKDKDKLIGKNNSQTYSSIKEIDRDNEKNINNYYIKGKNLVKEKNLFSNNKENSEINNFSINQSDIKVKGKEKPNAKKSRIKKENLSRNNNYPIYQFDTNIKTYYEDPMKIAAKNKNIITSYKTKSQTKNKTKGYQTSRNKYDNKNMYINISKSNISKNHQSIDSDMNNTNRIKKNMNQIQNKHNSLKNNLINALLGSQNNNQKKKITKYKDIMQKEQEQEQENDNKSSNGSIISIIDSNELKDIHNTSNNNIDIMNININNNNINENSIEQDIKENNKGFILEKNDSTNKRVISSSNIDKESNNRISSTSCTKTMSINSYGSKPKNFYGNNNNNNNNNNKMNHKKQISMSKIPNSLPENKIINNKMTKKMNKINEEIENKNKLKEFIDNYLDDYFSSNNNLNNNYIDSKNKSKSRTKNEPLTMRNNIQERRKEKDDNGKIRKSIFNFEKRISKKLSEKNLNIFDKFKNKSSPKDGKKNKTSTIKINKSGNMQNSDRCCPLSARESNLNYQINAEMIELLSNKIQKIKQSIKETSDKGSNSISSIFKKKKIPSANKKTGMLPLGIKKAANDFIEKKGNNSKTRNKKNKNGLIGATSSNSNIGISGNLVNTIINSIYQTNLLSPNKKNIEYDKLMKTFHKFKRPTNSFNGNNNGTNNSKGKYGNNNHNNNANNNNNINNNNKKDSKSKKKHGRYNSIYSNTNNYENNLNIEVNIKNNLKVQPKKQTGNNNTNNNKHAKDNLNSLNINFNNYTNNYNYNYNINSASSNSNNVNSNPVNNNNTNNANININTNNYSNSMVNKCKSSSQKIIMGKIVGKTDNNLKGIPINGFDKLITKKYNTRNYDIPLSVTERVKQANIYATSFATNNTNSNRYRNSNRAHMTINRIYQKK